MATTSPPPIVDAYLLNMSEGSFKTIENRLDINAFELVEVSPNQSFYAVVRGRNTQIYSMDGKLIFEEPGSFSWLDGNNLLIQNDRQVKRYELHSTEVRLVDTFATQTNCSQFQNQTPGLMECPVYLNNVSESVNRVFQLTPLKEIQSTQLIESYQEQDRNVILLARQIEQVPRMIETLSTKEGYSSLTVLDSSGKTKVLMRLNNPSTPEFKFDPKDDQWSGRY